MPLDSLMWEMSSSHNRRHTVLINKWIHVPLNWRDLFWPTASKVEGFHKFHITSFKWRDLIIVPNEETSFFLIYNYLQVKGSHNCLQIKRPHLLMFLTCIIYSYTFLTYMLICISSRREHTHINI